MHFQRGNDNPLIFGDNVRGHPFEYEKEKQKMWFVFRLAR